MMTTTTYRTWGLGVTALALSVVLVAHAARADEQRATVYDAQTAQRRAVIKDNTQTGRIEVYDARTAERLLYGQRRSSGAIDLYDAKTSQRKVIVVSQRK